MGHDRDSTGAKQKFRRHLSRKAEARSHYFEQTERVPLELDMITLPRIPKLGLGLGLDCENVLRSFQHYPRGADERLVERIARFEGVGPGNVMVTCGADMGLEITLSHLLDPGDSVSVMSPAFPRFAQISEELCGGRIGLFKGIHELPKTKAAIINTPNNPSTEIVPTGELESAIASNPEVFFILDGVFSAFARQKLGKLAGKFENVAVVNSVSKSHGLAGLRVGWIVSHEDNLRQFKRGVSRFHVPLLNQKLASVALAQERFVEEAVEVLNSEFAFLKKEVRAPLVRETDVPFYLVKVPDSGLVRERLLKHGISIVDCSTFPGMGTEHIRVRIGERFENRRLADALNSVLEKPWKA